MPTTKPKILFVAEAVTLAHVARASALASSLDQQTYEVCLASDPRYEKLLGTLPFPSRFISTIPAQRFFQAIANGSPIYDKATLIRYVEEDLELLQQYKPAAVVGDFRLSLGISARLAGVPYFNISNAYWSPYAQLSYPVPDIPLVRFVGVTLGQILFNLGRPAAFALHARPINQARKHFGLPALRADLRHAYTEADHVLYADIPEIVPTHDLPQNHHFLGPIAWSPRVDLPEWWNQLPDNRPIVYVTLGSSGQAKRLPDIMTALADLPVSIIAAHAGNPPTGPIPDNVWLNDFLPGNQAAQRAALVICNGGSPTSYQGLSAGTPVIGLAGNLDQYLNMNLLETAGAGRLLRATQSTVRSIREATRFCLESEEMHRRCKVLQGAIQKQDSCATFKNLLAEAIR